MWTAGWQTVSSKAGGPSALVALLLLLPPFAATRASAFEQPVVYCQLPVEQAPASARGGGLLPGAYGTGSRLMLLEPDGESVDLAPGFAGACDPDVSFDGTRILFAGQKTAGDPWNIWEVRVDGSELRQITHETLDARHPLYLATFYTITSSEPWYTILFVREDDALNESLSAPGTSLYTVRLDGSELRRITFHPGNDRTPYLMQDGLLAFAGLRSPSISRATRMALFGVQTDGIDYAIYGATDGKRLQHWPTVTSDGTVVFVEADSFDWDGAGSLGSVRARRPHHSYRPLSDASDGLFLSPLALTDGTVLVSRRLPGDVHRLVRFSPDAGVVETIHGDDSFHVLHARPVAARPEPDGRSSTVRPESPTGKLFALDIYERDPGLAALEPGSARRLRVIEGQPTSDRERSSGQIAFGTLPRRILGEATIEEDGSFHIDIPADLPVQLQVLDGDGLALATCDWIWVKQREFRGCIGCHEDPELTPPNRFVEAARRPADELTAPAEERRTVTFSDNIAPLLDQSCRSCHQAGGAAEDSSLRFDTAEMYQLFSRLLDPQTGFVEPGSARTSTLVWRLFGRDTSAPGDTPEATVKAIPTDHVGILTPEQRTVFVEWIDLGAQWSFGEGKGDDR